MLTVEATPIDLEQGEWKMAYQFASARGEPPKQAEIIANTETEFTFVIPIHQPKPPGIKATLRVVTTYWNHWFK
jgi:hypothetical protein